MAIERISIEIKSNAKEIEQQLSDIDSRIKKLNSSKAQINLNAEKLADAKKSIEEINLQIRKLQAQKAELKISDESADEVKVKMEEIQRAINTLRATKAKLQIETQELKGADTALNKLTKEMASLSNKKARLQVEQEDVAETETALSKLKSKLTEISSTKTSVNLSSNISSIGGQLDSMGSKLLSLVNPLKSQLSQWIGIGAAVKAVNSAISLVTSSVSSAVSRFDQINNYPTILQNLGVSAEDAAGSVERISESIQGLPTTLDFATKSVQGLVSALSGDLGMAEELFDAANNAAMVFAQGSESALDSFMLQYRQALSKGRIYAQEFNIMAEAMPGLMEQIAKLMGESTADLKEGLGEGTISVDEFNDALMTLNKEGVGSFKALSESAQDSVSGIATGVTNMRTAVTRGVTNVIDSLDKLLEKANLGGFTGLFAGIGSAFESGLTRLGEVATENEDIIVGFIEKIRSFDWASVWSGFKESITELKESARSFLDTMEPVIDFVKNRITDLGDGSFAKGLGKLPALLLKVAVGAKVLGKALKVLGKVTNFKLPSIFGSSDSEGSTGLSFNFDAGQMLNQVKNLALVYGVIKTISAAAQALKDINDKVPADLGKLAPKLVNMGIALAGMGALVAVAGKLAENNLVAAVAGLVVIAGISADLMIAAEAMKQVDEKVPTGIATFAEKLANMAIAIGGMGLIVGAVGALMATGVGALVAGAGLVTVALLAADLILVAEAVSQLDSKVPSNVSGVKKKIENIAEAIGYFTAANLGTAIDLFENVVGVLNVAVVTKGIDKMNDLANALRGFRTGSINANEIREKLKSIESVIETFTTSRLGNVGTTFKNFVSDLNIKEVTEGIKSMSTLSAELDNIELIDDGDIKNKIKSIESVFRAFTNARFGDAITYFTNNISELNLEEARSAIEKMNQLPEAIGNTKNVDVGLFKKRVTNIAEAFKVFTSADLGTVVTKFTNYISGLNLDEVKKAIEKMNALPETIESARGVNVELFAGKVKTLSTAFGIFTGADFGGFFTALKNAFSEANLAILNKALTTMDSISTSLDNLKEANTKGLQKKINSYVRAFDIITGADFGNVLTTVETFFTEKNLDNVIKTLNSLNSISAGVMSLQGSEIDTAKLGTVIGNVTTAIDQLKGSNFATDETVTAEALTKVIEAVNVLTSLVSSINAIGTLNTEEALTTISGVKDILQKINELPAVIDTAVLESIVAAINNLTTALKNMEGLFAEVGTGYGDQLVAGFESADIVTKIVAVIDSLIKKLNGKKSKFTEMGKAYGDNLRKAFETEVKNLYKAIDAQITRLKNYSTSFTSLGTNYGTAMVIAFNTAISRLSTSITSQVNSIQTSLNSLTVPSLSTSIGSSASSAYLSSGGQVPQYLASGGVAGAPKKRGTDTVSAMLTPGEYIHTTEAVKTFGLDFMNRINNLDIKGAFNALAGRFSTYSMAAPIMSSVVNNTDNRVNKPNVTQNFTNSGQNHSLRRMNRYLQKLGG